MATGSTVTTEELPPPPPVDDGGGFLGSLGSFFNSTAGVVTTAANASGQIVSGIQSIGQQWGLVESPQDGGGNVNTAQPVTSVSPQSAAASTSQPAPVPIQNQISGGGFFGRVAASLGLPLWSAMLLVGSVGLLLFAVFAWIIKKVF